MIINDVELIYCYGSDTDICDAARVSHDKQASQYTKEQNAKLINFLAKHKHWSPFRHVFIKFRITCPIYIERQLATHVIGISKNSISGRYVDFSDSYTEIGFGNWRGNPDNIKQGSGLPIQDEHIQSQCDLIQKNIIAVAQQYYQQLLKYGICKEQARTILPLSLNTKFIWTLSFQAFQHLCDLRLKPDAQKETRDIVAKMLELVKATGAFDESLKAFNLY